MHIPQPIQSVSEMAAILSLGVTSMQSFPILTTGQDFLHSCRHLLGLHLSELTMAIRVNLSVSSKAFFLDDIILGDWMEKRYKMNDSIRN
jgi:hypothetical protein